MERKNTILLTIIAIVTLLIALIGATFAYFTVSGTVSSNSTGIITTSDIDTVSGGSTNCSLSVAASDMQEANSSANGTIAKSASCNLGINATKSERNPTPTKCTYDITYTPNTTSPNEAIVHSTANTSSLKEISLAGSTELVLLNNITATGGPFAETDLYTLNTKTTIIDDATITFTGTSGVIWNFTVKFYNYSFNQNDLAGKSFGGTLAIENLVCSAAPSN